MKKHRKYEETPVELVEVEEVEEVQEEETVEMVEPMEVVEPEVSPMLDGIVIGCTRLNVRKAPEVGAEVETTILNGTMLKLDPSKSNDTWYYVCTPVGIEGYCMKAFVKML